MTDLVPLPYPCAEEEEEEEEEPGMGACTLAHKKRGLLKEEHPLGAGSLQAYRVLFCRYVLSLHYVVVVGFALYTCLK